MAMHEVARGGEEGCEGSSPEGGLYDSVACIRRGSPPGAAPLSQQFYACSLGRKKRR